jgi:hypothetical protein
VSPEQLSSKAQLSLLRDEARKTRAALSRHAQDGRDLIARWGEPSRQDLAYGAFLVHGWYTALESFFERVATEVDGDLPKGESWHRELLTQMSLAIPELRPAVVPAALKRELGKLLAFRHFFRHASAVVEELEPEPIHEHLERLLRLEPEVIAALDAFDAFLVQALAILSG